MAVGGRAWSHAGAETPVPAVHHWQRQVGRRGHAAQLSWEAGKKACMALSLATWRGSPGQDKTCLGLCRRLHAGPQWAAWPSCRC